jgi:hypothetical protein
VESFRLAITRGEEDELVALPDPLVLGDRLRDGDLASLELSLVSPLPHVAVAGATEVGRSDAVVSDKRVVQGAELPTYELLRQSPGSTAIGPAVIEGPFFTMRLPAGWRFRTTAAGDLLLTNERST